MGTFPAKPSIEVERHAGDVGQEICPRKERERLFPHVEYAPRIEPRLGIVTRSLDRTVDCVWIVDHEPRRKRTVSVAWNETGRVYRPVERIGWQRPYSPRPTGGRAIACKTREHA